jgi:hypothetical protein
MDLLFKIVDLVQQPWLIKTVLTLACCWVAMNMVCWVFGALALYKKGKAKACKPYLPAFIPGGQVWYTLQLAGESSAANRAEHLLWWCPTLVIAAGADVVWSAVHYLQGGRATVLYMLALAVLLLLAAVALYVWIRVLEFKALGRLLENKTFWIIALVGTVLVIPVQRILLFIKKSNA